jgi:hypothetical protein
VLRLSAIHLVFSLAKRWLLGTDHGAVGEKHLPAYLDEFVFRFNPPVPPRASGTASPASCSTLFRPRPLPTAPWSRRQPDVRGELVAADRR